MTTDEFAIKLKNAIFKEGDDREIRVSKVLKNNGISLTGLSVVDENRRVTPTVYVEDYLERYEEGTPFAVIVRQIRAMLDYRDGDIDFDLGSFSRFETAKDRIVYKLINGDMNEKLLEEVPHVDFLDMAIVFYYVLSDRGEKQASILIHNDHAKNWGVGRDELMETAAVNTPRLLPAKIFSMNELMLDLLRGNEAAELQGQELSGDVPAMYVMTNERKYFGAASLLYGGMGEKCAEKLGGSFYILPSSVHELILLKSSGVEEPSMLADMVREVNDTQVAAEEVLSYNVYRYDEVSGRIETVGSERNEGVSLRA